MLPTMCLSTERVTEKIGQALNLHYIIIIDLFIIINLQYIFVYPQSTASLM